MVARRGSWTRFRHLSLFTALALGGTQRTETSCFGAGPDSPAGPGALDCDTDGWCWASPATRGDPISGLFATSEGGLWAVGDGAQFNTLSRNSGELTSQTENGISVAKCARWTPPAHQRKF